MPEVLAGFAVDDDLPRGVAGEIELREAGG